MDMVYDTTNNNIIKDAVIMYSYLITSEIYIVNYVQKYFEDMKIIIK